MKKLVVLSLVLIIALSGCLPPTVDLSEIKADIAALQEEQASQGDEILVLQLHLDEAEGRLDALEAGGNGGNGTTDAYHIPIKVYCDHINTPMNYDAIEYEIGTVSGVMLGMQFSIANGLRVNEPCDTIYMAPEIPLAGAGPRFIGVAWLEGGHHGQTVLGMAEWKRVPGSDVWAVRVEFDNFDWKNEVHRSGFEYYGKRPFMRGQWIAFSGDSVIVTIPMTLGWTE